MPEARTQNSFSSSIAGASSHVDLFSHTSIQNLFLVVVICQILVSKRSNDYVLVMTARAISEVILIAPYHA
jgi:hypothetical protein